MASVPALLDAAAASSRGRGPRRGPPPRRREEGEPRPPRSSNNERQPPKRRNMDPVAEDETGIIESLMDAFGFIKCADRDMSLFFHFSEMKDSSKQPEIGDELQFAIVRDSERRERATRIDVLPKGSVVFEVVEKSNLTGLITAALQYNNKTKRKEGFGGRVSVSPQVESNSGNGSTDSNGSGSGVPAQGDTKIADEVYEFSERDIVDTRVPLREGDEVEFDVFIEKRTGKTGATRITLLKPCPTGRVKGVVSNVVAGASFGFIEGEDDRSLFFPLSEVIDSKAVVVEGTEMEFTVVKDRGGKDRAVSIVVLPPGSVQVWKVAPGDKLEGTVTAELPSPAQRASGKGGKGMIEVTNEDGSKENVTFSIGDIHMKTRKTLLKGDGVRLRVATRGPTEPKRGRDIELVRETETDRERGVVVPGKPNVDRIFISCENRRTPLSMAASEVPTELSARLKPGAEIEFTVASDGAGGRPCAIRPKELPKGSVVLVEVGAEVLEGFVVKELIKKTSFHNKVNFEPPRGVIRVGNEEKKSTQYSFGEGDLAEDEKIGAHNLFVGDKVKFHSKLDKQTKRQSATQIQLVSMNDKRVTGVVTKDSGPSGKVMGSVPGLQLQFAFTSVLDPTLPPQVGDCVEFDLRKDAAGKDYAARLSRLPAGSVVVEDMSNVVKGVVESVGKEGGTIALEGEGPAHPATISLPVIPKTENYSPERNHPAALYLARGRNGTLGFWHDDARPEGRAIFVAKGDAVNLVICSHVADPMCRRAVQISTRPKSTSAKKVVAVSAKRSVGPSSGGRFFLRTSQIEAMKKGKAVPGDDTEEETDESVDSSSKAED